VQPGEGFAVRPAELQAHADHLSQIAVEVSMATDAARYVRIHREAYGKVCSFVPDELNELSAPLVDGLQAIIGSLNSTALRLEVAAEAYGAADGRATDRQQRGIR
jgi:hypothetical protein